MGFLLVAGVNFEMIHAMLREHKTLMEMKMSSKPDLKFLNKNKEKKELNLYSL